MNGMGMRVLISRLGIKIVRSLHDVYLHELHFPFILRMLLIVPAYAYASLSHQLIVSPLFLPFVSV